MPDERVKRQSRSGPVTFKTRDDDGGSKKYISGHFAVFNRNYELWPGASESIANTAFDGALDDDIRALINHDTRLVLGRNKSGTLKLSVDSVGLFGEVEVNQNDTDAMNLYARVQRGDVSQCSFGFDILDEETSYKNDGSVHWTIKRVKLYEVTVATFPAYEDTGVTARKADYENIQARKRDERKLKIKEKLEVLKHGT